MKQNKEYRAAGWAVLKGNWEQSIIATFIVMVLPELLAAVMWGFSLLLENGVGGEFWAVPVIVTVMIILQLSFVYFLMIPAAVGLVNSFNLLYSRGDGRILSNMKSLTFSDVARSALGIFMVNLVTWLFSLLLFIPGLIASIALFPVPFLLKERPEISVMDTLRLSRKMMDGHKMQLFKLILSFLGWAVLNMFTLGVGSLWLTPYMLTTLAAFYQDVKAEYLMKEVQ